MHNSDLHGLLATAMSSTPHPAQIMCGLPINEHSESWYWIADGKFTPLLARATGSSTASGSSISLRDELARVGGDIGEAVELITRSMVERLAKLMMVPASDIDANKPLSAYGVDSLVAVEVRNWIAKEMNVEVSVFEIMANVPMRALAADLAGKSKLIDGVQQ